VGRKTHAFLFAFEQANQSGNSHASKLHRRGEQKVDRQQLNVRKTYYTSKPRCFVKSFRPRIDFANRSLTRLEIEFW
jgi:hypothetical protein